MNEEIDSISISDLIWGEAKENRISFSFKGLPQSVHFTIAWNKQTGKINLHITRNTGDGSNKPKVVIAYFDKAFLDELMLFAPTVILGKIFRLLSFKKYSRKERKKVWLVFPDELEMDTDTFNITEELNAALRCASKIKRNKLKISNEFEQHFLATTSSDGMKMFMLNHLRRVNKSSFNSPSWRVGILLRGGKVGPFISANGKCYAITKRLSIYELLISFARPEFARDLTGYIDEALERMKVAETYDDTRYYNRPYTLCIEKAG